MENTKHTPGEPYKVYSLDLAGKLWTVAGPTETGCGTGFKAQHKADEVAGYLNAAHRAGKKSANSAMPDLLAALEAIVNYQGLQIVVITDDQEKQARAAIAKATAP